MKKMNIVTGIISVGMTLCLCAGIAFSVGTFSTFTASADTWDGTANTDWYDSGSTVDGVTTYTIDSAAGLAGLASKVNSGTTFSGCVVNLTASVDLDGSEYTWTPIGTITDGTEYPFSGTFNGGNNTISNLYNDSYTSYVGLFGYIADAKIENVTIENVTLYGLEGVGGVVGWADQANTALDINSSISGCEVTGLVQITGEYCVGGILGCGEKSSVYNCTVDATETGSYITGEYEKENLEGDNVGGIAGFIGVTQNTGLVSKMYNVAVSGLTISGSRKIGGILGYTNVKGYETEFEITTDDTDDADAVNSVKNCTIAITNVTGYSDTIEDKLFVGAVLGATYFSVSIDNCDIYDVTVKYYTESCVYQGTETDDGTYENIGYYGGVNSTVADVVITLTNCTGSADLVSIFD